MQITVWVVIIPDWQGDLPSGSWNCPEACYTSEDKANEHCNRLIADDAADGVDEEQGYVKPYVTDIYVDQSG